MRLLTECYSSSCSRAVGRVINDAGINRSEPARQIGIDASKFSEPLTGARNINVKVVTLVNRLTEVATDWLAFGTVGRTLR